MRLGKYNTAYTFTVPLVKAGDTAFAASADWTPAAGDVKISKDGGAVANIGTLPTAVTGTGSVLWQFSVSATEMQAKNVVIQVVDAALENSAFEIHTFGNASAAIVFDLSVAQQTVTAAQVSSGGITSSSFGSGAITETALANDAITAAKIANGAIDAATFAADAITSTTFATDAIDNNALATNAATEIMQSVIGSVMETRSSGNITLQGAMRLLIAYAAGRRAGNTYSTPDDTKARITGTVSGGDRTAVTLDTTD